MATGRLTIVYGKRSKSSSAFLPLGSNTAKGLHYGTGDESYWAAVTRYRFRYNTKNDLEREDLNSDHINSFKK